VAPHSAAARASSSSRNDALQAALPQKRRREREQGLPCKAGQGLRACERGQGLPCKPGQGLPCKLPTEAGAVPARVPRARGFDTLIACGVCAPRRAAGGHSMGT
jgi:hypothetical protein